MTETIWSQYSCLDAAITRQAWDSIDDEMTETGYQSTFQQTMELYPTLIHMSVRGYKTDIDALNKLRKETQDEIRKREGELTELCGFALNIDSPKQCANYFYVVKGIKPYTNRKTGRVTCDDKALARMAIKGVREASIIQRIRYLGKLEGTYLSVAIDSDGRVRCSWNPRGTKFGRLSSSKTIFGTGLNFQNLHPEFRRFLVPDDGQCFLSWDKRQAEWVVTAYVCEDANMLLVVESGADPHTATGSLISGLTPEQVKMEDKAIAKLTDPEGIAKVRAGLNLSGSIFLPRTMSVRQMGKKGNHGLNYDEGPYRFALEYELESSEGKRAYTLYHDAYPGLRQYYQRTQHELGDDRVLENCFGRKVRFLDLWGNDLFKSAYSFKPQSTVADLINRGLTSITRDQSSYMNPLDLQSQSHDSVDAQYPVGEWLAMARTVTKVTEHINPVMEYHSREFQIGTDLKIGINGTDMVEVELVENETEMADRLETAYGSFTQ